MKRIVKSIFGIKWKCHGGQNRAKAAGRDLFWPMPMFRVPAVMPATTRMIFARSRYWLFGGFGRWRVPA